MSDSILLKTKGLPIEESVTLFPKTVLTGVNGAGKSTLLAAMKEAMGQGDLSSYGSTARAFILGAIEMGDICDLRTMGATGPARAASICKMLGAIATPEQIAETIKESYKLTPEFASEGEKFKFPTINASIEAVALRMNGHVGLTSTINRLAAAIIEPTTGTSEEESQNSITEINEKLKGYDHRKELAMTRLADAEKLAEGLQFRDAKKLAGLKKEAEDALTASGNRIRSLDIELRDTHKLIASEEEKERLYVAYKANLDEAKQDAKGLDMSTFAALQSQRTPDFDAIEMAKKNLRGLMSDLEEARRKVSKWKDVINGIANVCTCPTCTQNIPEKLTIDMDKHLVELRENSAKCAADVKAEELRVKGMDDKYYELTSTIKKMQAVVTAHEILDTFTRTNMTKKLKGYRKDIASFGKLKEAEELELPKLREKLEKIEGAIALVKSVDSAKAALEEFPDNMLTAAEAQALEENRRYHQAVVFEHTEYAKSMKQLNDVREQAQRFREVSSALKALKAKVAKKTEFPAAVTEALQEVLGWKISFGKINRTQDVILETPNGIRSGSQISAGEHQIVCAAFAMSKPNAVVLVEAAEIDNEHYYQLLAMLAKHEGFVIVADCHARIPEGWEEVAV